MTSSKKGKELNRSSPALADAKAGSVLDELISAVNAGNPQGVITAFNAVLTDNASLRTQLNALVADVGAIRTKFNLAQTDISSLYTAVIASSNAPTAKSSSQAAALTAVAANAATATAQSAMTSTSANYVKGLDERGTR